MFRDVRQRAVEEEMKHAARERCRLGAAARGGQAAIVREEQTRTHERQQQRGLLNDGLDHPDVRVRVGVCGCVCACMRVRVRQIAN